MESEVVKTRYFSIIIVLLFLTTSTAFASGKLQNTLYLNDRVYDQFLAPEKIKISAEEWQEWLKVSKSKDKHDRPLIRFGKDWKVRLHIKNNSDLALKNPLLKITFGENWGSETKSIKTLEPPLQSGESIDVTVNLSDYEFVGSDQTSVYIMLDLSKDENIPANENHWCIWFDLE